RLGRPVPGKPWLRPFKANLILNLPENKIDVELPNLAKELGTRDEFVVPCRQPVRGQHLHIIVLAPGLDRKQRDVLKKDIARAMELEAAGPKDFYKSKVFDQARMDVLAYVNNSKVDSILFDVRGRLHERARLGQPNDAVMFYFLGQETVGSQDRLLW